MINVERLDAFTDKDRYQCWLHIQKYFFACEHAVGPVIADIACGTGYGSFLLALNHPGTQVVGYDIDRSVIVRARKTYQAPNLSFQVGDLANPCVVDTIVSMETLEHVADWKNTFARLVACSQVLIWSVPWKQAMTPVTMMYHEHFGFCDETFWDMVPQNKEMCSRVQLMTGEIVHITKAKPSEIYALMATLKIKEAQNDNDSESGIQLPQVSTEVSAERAKSGQRAMETTPDRRQEHGEGDGELSKDSGSSPDLGGFAPKKQGSMSNRRRARR